MSSTGQPGLLLGELLVRMGLVTPAQVTEALERQRESGERLGEALISLGHLSQEKLQAALADALGLAVPPLGHQPPLGEVLLGLCHITEQQLREALARQQRDNRKLGEILVELGACTYRQLYEGLSLQQRMSSEPAPVSRPEAPAASGVTVLVVDDSPLACQLVEQGLGELGYQVTSLSDPFQALEQLPKLRPSIVLTDLDMPGMDGAELCQRLKGGAGPQVPVVILTVNDEDAQRIHGLRAGADDYVNKGASMGELAARIDSIVRRAAEASRVRELFARYTSDAVVEEILKQGKPVLTGEKREVTVMFADIRKFTALAEAMPPEQVVALLNQVLGRMADAVLTCGGTLDKFLGDGLMAVFGAPVGHEDDAVRALQAARMMMDAVQQLNEQAKLDQRQGAPRAPAPELELGVGVNSGVAVAGNVGSARRVEYTCIGDAVNVAARLCSLARPGEILVGERTCTLASHAGPFELLPPMQLKGKQRPVPVFRAHWYRSPLGDKQG